MIDTQIGRYIGIQTDKKQPGRHAYIHRDIKKRVVIGIGMTPKAPGVVLQIRIKDV